MELDKGFNYNHLEKKSIIYPAYQTTNKFHNLYSDVRTWIRELIQNADDADSESIQFYLNLSEKKIEIINNGHPFDSNDIKRLLTPCLGGKDLDKTGAMNLGALSVLSISDEPFYHSGNTLLKFEMNHELKDFIPYLDEKYNTHFNGTRLILPLHSRLSSDDMKKLKNADEYLKNFSFLLFTRKLTNIALIYPNKKFEISKITENETKFRYKKKKALMKEISISENFTNGIKSTISESKWLIAEQRIEVPKEYLSNNDIQNFTKDIIIPIYIAFALDNNIPKRVNYPIYIIFPSETIFGFGFVLSSNFRPETSRKSFSTEGIDGKFNKYLLEKATELVEIVLNYFKEKISSYSTVNKIQFFNALINTLYYRETYTPFEQYITEYIDKKILKFLENNILDDNGNWYKSSKVAIGDSDLTFFFKDNYSFISHPINEQSKNLLKKVGVKELSIELLIEKLISEEFKDFNDLKNVWNYIFINQNKLNNEIKKKILNNKTLLNNAGMFTTPLSLFIPEKEAIGLYDANLELHSEFVKNNDLNNFLLRIGIEPIKPKQIFNYFLANKTNLSKKNIELIIRYYSYFYKYNLWDKKKEIILTDQGFKNPEEAFFNRVKIKNIFGRNIPLIPREIELSRICKTYLKNLGVSKEITAKYILNYIIKYGSSVISIDLLKFLAKNSNKLSNSDLIGLENMKIIPTTNGKFVKPKDCYLLTVENKKVFEDLVDYFDPKDENNQEWIKFFKKIGLSKNPKIYHLRLALLDSINKYKKLKAEEKFQKKVLLERIELIILVISKNKENKEKERLLEELRELEFLPTTKGVKKPRITYLNKNNIQVLLGDSVPLCLINLPEDLINLMSINKDPIPEDVANYLFNVLVKQKEFKSNLLFKEAPVKIFDKIYSFLGITENFKRLKTKTINDLFDKPIIYLPGFNCFEVGSNLFLYSREAEIIYGDTRNLIKYSDYPNSLNFFRKIGVKTSLNSDDIAEYLMDYVKKEHIDTERLFMFYNLVGQRFRFLSRDKQQKLKKSKIILNEDLKSFEHIENIFIPDDRLYIEKFPTIKIAIINNKIIDFLENVGVKKISEIIDRNIIFAGNIFENDFSKSILKKIIELIPFLEIIIKESNFSLDSEWINRIYKLKCFLCDSIYYEIKYKNKKERIIGKFIEYDSSKNAIGFVKDVYQNTLIKTLMDLSKTISYILFKGDLAKAKIMGPIIEKLLESENKIQTLKNIGFSTLKLEIKNTDGSNLTLTIPKIVESYKTNNEITSSQQLKLNNNLTQLIKKNNSNSIINLHKNFNFKVENYDEYNNNISHSKENFSNFQSKDQIDIVVKKTPSQPDLIKIVQKKLADYSNFNLEKLSKYYALSSNEKKILNYQKKKLYNSLEFPGKVIFGGFDITPNIPKLEIKNIKGFEYFIQKDYYLKIELTSLKRFQTMLKFIISLMGGNPETIMVALFDAPIEAFNYNGQLVFNYLLLVNNELEKEFPLYLIWIMVSAHELAHCLCPNHDQMHLKYTTIFTLYALKNLETIKQQFFELYNDK